MARPLAPTLTPLAGARGAGNWTEFFTAVHWVQAFMAALSVIGSSSMIGYAVFHNTVRSPEVRPLFYLSLSDLFLGLCWLAGALFYSTEAPKTSDQDIACYNLQTTGQIFYLASFLYTINYTWHLYMDLKVKYNQSLCSRLPQILSNAQHIGRIAIILSSLVPFLLMAPAFGVGNHYECYRNFTMKHGCLLMHTETNLVDSQQQTACFGVYLYSIGLFLISFSASFVAILVLLLRARSLYKKVVSSSGYLGDQQWAMIQMVEQRVILYPVVFFCCWGPAFVLGIVKLTSLENMTVYMALWVLEALTASSQGLLNCAVYSWTLHMFHCIKRKACRDVDTQTPLLRSQKRFYASTIAAKAEAVTKASSTAL